MLTKVTILKFKFCPIYLDIYFWQKNYRLTSAEDILKYWNTIGIENGEMVLQDLGLYIEDESDAENIDVNELTRVLQVSCLSLLVP